jgi:hypothetical protein
VSWLLKAAWDKINLLHTWRELVALGQKYGRRFFIAAILWEAIEDLVFPFFSWRLGVPELIPLFLILHFEPIVYPAFFWGFKMWDRLHGLEPWDPDRPAHSHYWRSVVKVLVFQLAVTGWLSQVLPAKTLVVFTILISLFGFVHERIWNDSNYGILPDDTVQTRRVLSKASTYLLVCLFVFFPLLRVGGIPIWRSLLVAQAITGTLYIILETVWSKSVWGVHNVGEIR